MRGHYLSLLAAVVVAFAATQSALCGVADAYLSAYLEMFPTRATQAGDHAFDSKLADFSAEQLNRWVEFNQAERGRLTKLLIASDLPFDDRLDAEALLAQVERELHQQTVLRRPQRDPLYWSEVIANAAVFLLVRAALPLAARPQRARARPPLLPAFTHQCRSTLPPPTLHAFPPDLCQLSAGPLPAPAPVSRPAFTIAAANHPARRSAA